jgi:hypothetical protein
MSAFKEMLERMTNGEDTDSVELETRKVSPTTSNGNTSSEYIV